MKICIVSVYFGTLPPSFAAWKKSVAANASVDFLLVTDQPVQSDLPNLRVVSMQFSELVAYVKELYGEDTVLDRPYKLCDYKPAYGEIFEEYLTGCDYYGYCDMDLVFGNLEKLLQSYDLPRYDRFLKLGHLCLVKWEYRYLYKKSSLWEPTCRTSSITIFDECENGVYAAFRDAGLCQYEGRPFVDITRYKRRFTSLLRTNEDRSYRFEIYVWENGALYRYYWHRFSVCRQEALYVHFQKRHMADAIVDIGYETVERFALCEKGFIPAPEKIGLSFIFKNNPYRGWLVEKIEEMRGLKKQYPYLYTPKRCINKTIRSLRKFAGKDTK